MLRCTLASTRMDIRPCWCLRKAPDRYGFAWRKWKALGRVRCPAACGLAIWHYLPRSSHSGRCVSGNPASTVGPADPVDAAAAAAATATVGRTGSPRPDGCSRVSFHHERPSVGRGAIPEIVSIDPRFEAPWARRGRPAQHFPDRLGDHHLDPLAGTRPRRRMPVHGQRMPGCMRRPRADVRAHPALEIREAVLQRPPCSSEIVSYISQARRRGSHGRGVSFLVVVPGVASSFAAAVVVVVAGQAQVEGQVGAASRAHWGPDGHGGQKANRRASSGCPRKYCTSAPGRPSCCSASLVRSRQVGWDGGGRVRWTAAVGDAGGVGAAQAVGAGVTLSLWGR